MIDRGWKICMTIGLLVGLCAIVFTLFDGSHFHWETGNGGSNISIKIGSEGGGTAELLGGLAVILLILGSAFYASKKRIKENKGCSPAETEFSFLTFLQNLKKSSFDVQIGGVCGGLGEYSPVPSWVWRTIFIVLFFCYGVGLLPYLLLWVSMPSADRSNNAVDAGKRSS